MLKRLQPLKIAPSLGPAWDIKKAAPPKEERPHFLSFSHVCFHQRGAPQHFGAPALAFIEMRTE